MGLPLVNSSLQVLPLPYLLSEVTDPTIYDSTTLGLLSY